jgi:hypothetical protein
MSLVSPPVFLPIAIVLSVVLSSTPVTAVDVGGAGARLAQIDGGSGEGSSSERHREPIPFPTPGDPRRWNRPADTMPRSARDRRDDADADADVDTARDEAAELRRQAAELRESLDRAEAQGKRGAKVKEDPAVARRRAEDLEEQISDLQKRARALDDEAATLAEPPPGTDSTHDNTAPLPGDDDDPAAPSAHGPSAHGADQHRAKDPLSDDMDDDLEGDDDLGGGMD